LEDFLKYRLTDTSAKQFEGLMCILVQSIWWAQNLNVFKNEKILLEVTTSLIIKLAKEFMIDHKSNIPRVPSMPNLDFKVTWDFFNGAN
jgi:hypothetical protein